MGLSANQIMAHIEEVRGLYHRLILIVGPAGSGKTSALQEVSSLESVPIINVNLELSRRMLDLTQRQRALQLPRLLDDIIGDVVGDLVILDNVEILFDVCLKQDPLRLLQRVSRNKTVLAAWNGSISGNYVIYAVANHPEYRRYPIHGFLVAS